MWSIERVEFRNAHQMFGDAGIPWTMEDMLGTGNREGRASEHKADKATREMELLKLQRGLGSITADKAPEELLPDWAKRKWDPKDYPHIFGAGAQ